MENEVVTGGGREGFVVQREGRQHFWTGPCWWQSPRQLRFFAAQSELDRLGSKGSINSSAGFSLCIRGEYFASQKLFS